MDLSSRYYHAEKLIWISFLLILSDRYFSIPEISTYLESIDAYKILRLEYAVCLFLIWSQLEYLQSEYSARENVVVRIRNKILWLITIVVTSFSIEIKQLSQEVVTLWILGWIILGYFLSQTAIPAIIINILTFFGKNNDFSRGYNLRIILFNSLLIVFAYYVVRRIAPIEIPNQIIYPALLFGTLPFLYQFSIAVIKGEIKEIIRTNKRFLYDFYLNDFGKNERRAALSDFKSAVKEDTLVDSQSGENVRLDKKNKRHFLKIASLSKLRLDPIRVRELAINRSKKTKFSQKEKDEIPIFIAVSQENIDKVKELLGTKNVNSEFDSVGWSPLILAVANGYTAIVNLLLSHGANPNQANLKGITPLLFACRYGDLEIVRKLIFYGVDTSISDPDNFSPIAVAIKHGHDEIALFLLPNCSLEDLTQAIPIAENCGNGRIARVLRKSIKNRTQ